MNIAVSDANLVFVLLGAIVTVLGFGLAVFGISTGLKRGNRISTRLDQYIAPEVEVTDDSTARPIIPREIRGSLFSRTISNWTKKTLQFMGRFTPVKMAAKMEHKLTIAGNPSNLHASEFFTLRLLVFVGGSFLAYFINRDIKNISRLSLLLGLLIFFICIIFPMVWLNGRVRSRQDEIRRGLPDALDMLSLCASAGLGFDQSLQKISHYWDTELGHELKQVTQEMEMGVARSTALRNMTNRLDVDDLSRFVAIINQAERIGMSYADVLHSQAQQMRVLRQYQARELANKLPGKMIIPVALLIFPAMLAVILGPAIPQIFSLIQ